MLLVGAAAVLIAAIVFFYRRQQAAPAPAAFSVTPITRLAGKEYQPSISPDGSTVAFLWTEEGSTAPAVWISPAGDPSPRALTNSPAVGHQSRFEFGDSSW